jgi:PAS domain S-box-containing protein
MSRSAAGPVPGYLNALHALPLLASADAHYLSEMFTRLSNAASRHDVIATLRAGLRDLVRADGIAVIIGDNGCCHYVAEDAQSPLWAGSSFPMDQCISGHAMRDQTTIVIDDVMADHRVPHAAYARTFVRSLAVAPAGPNAALGAYWSERAKPGKDDVQLLEVVASAAAIALENVHLKDMVSALRAGNGSSLPPTMSTRQTGTADAALQFHSDDLAAFDHLPVLAWIADASGYVYRFNKAWYDYTGRSAEEMRGWGWRVVHHPDQAAATLARWKEVLVSGDPVELTFALRRHDGQYRPFLTRAVPFRDAGGAISHWLGTSTDISGLEAAEHRAEEAARLLQDVIDHLPSAVYTKDAEGRLTMANAATLEVLGKSWDEAAMRTDAAWFDEGQAAQVQAFDRQVMESGMTLEVEELAGYHNGEPRVFLSRKSPLFDREGKVRGIVGSSIDITDRKRAESAMIDRENYLRRVLDQLFAFVGVTTVEGVLTFTNASPLEAGGVTSDEVWGQIFWECPWWAHSSEAQEICQDAIRQAAGGEVYRRDVVVRMADDVLATIDYQAAPLRGDDGSIDAIIHSGVLIEERVRAEQLKETLIGELHHRVKNLFSIVLGMVQMTARNAADKDAMTAALSGRILALANAHDLVRPDPAVAGAETPINLDVLVARVVAPHGADRFAISGEPLSVCYRAITPLALILHELATNAAKYGSLSADDGRVAIGWTIAGERLNLCWRESGGPVLSEPAELGFGSKLMRMSAARQLGGNIEKDWLADGLLATVDLDLAQVTGC